MDRRQAATLRHHSLPILVIVDNLHPVDVPVVPHEANAILIVDTETVLATSVAGERFESVAGEGGEVTKLTRGVQLLQFALGDPSDLLQTPTEGAREERLGVGILERPDHLGPSL